MFHLHLSTICIVFIVQFVLISLPPEKVSSLGTGSTIAVSFGSNTICGILAGEKQSIECYRQGQIIPISPANVGYDSITGGRDFFCGLTAGGVALHCWDTSFSNASFQASTLYDNSTSPLTSLSVGEFQICVLHAFSGLVQCWRRNQDLADSSSPFSLPKNTTQFRSITSGGGFSCGIVKDSGIVSCWGQSGIGDFIESEFGNMSMLSLIAGKSHACGLTISGELICKGSNSTGQIDVPTNSDFQFSSVALGENQTCAVESQKKSVLCWGGDDLLGSSQFTDFIIASFSFESIVAGLDFTCGLTSDLGMICWGSGWPTRLSFSMGEIPLPKMIPGPCVEDPCGVCGSHINSTSLCAKKGTRICSSCLAPLSPPPVLEEPPSPEPEPGLEPGMEPESPQGSSISVSPSPKGNNRPYWVYQVFGGLGIFVILTCLAFFVWKKKSDGPSKPALEPSGSKVPLNSTTDMTFVTSNPSSAPHSRSSSITHSSSSIAALRTMSSSRPGSRSEKFSLSALSAATESFSADNIIGSGSFGTVFRGRMANGQPVAIKREEMMSERRMKTLVGIDTAFDSELELLSRLHHKHLVGLVGFCQERDERLLVYEYMSNGALHDHLHTEKGDTTLNSWRKRIKIALDAARGVEYLHNYAVPPIIHRDIKSSNILIDSNWIARVSDFGLSLMGIVSDHGEASSMSIGTVGTVGYIDPEYYVLKVLTTKSDVYGFGVVLLEILTGKKAVFRDTEGLDPVLLVEHAGPYVMGGEVWKVLDKRVGYPLLNEAEAVELVAQTAVRCVSLEGKERPSMSDVVANLEKAFLLCKDNPGAYSRCGSSAADFNQ